MSVPDQRGFGKQVKRIVPGGVFRVLTVVFNTLMRAVPFRLKYGVGLWLRRNKAPYKYLQPTDTVVQVGCARDILRSGRSRVIFLSLQVSQGRVILVEADPANCAALRRVVAEQGLENIEIVECGAWAAAGKLTFLSSPGHPAANLFVAASEAPQDVLDVRKYASTVIDVNTLDNILANLKAATPALVSITTNGAELQILEGLRQTIAEGCEFISLASTGEGFHQRMSELGYRYVARDDRGYCFRLEQAAHSEAEQAA